MLTPLMGLVKGTVGPDFIISWVDFELDVTLTQTARRATADCQRMEWDDGRWMIGQDPTWRLGQAEFGSETRCCVVIERSSNVRYPRHLRANAILCFCVDALRHVIAFARRAQHMTQHRISAAEDEGIAGRPITIAKR